MVIAFPSFDNGLIGLLLGVVDQNQNEW